ncbi:MAG: hypothetical protein AB7K52_03305 [Phycisphaerales bacterium]
MTNPPRIMALLALAGGGLALTGTLAAQDSVGRTASGTGSAVKDNLDAYNGSQFRSKYVLDLVPFTSSWGNTFRIGPALKTSNASNGSALTSAFANANALSSTQRDVFFSETGLDAAFWSGLAGQNAQGVNSVALANGPTNDTPGAMTLFGAAKRMCLAVIERNSSGATGNNTYNAVVGAILTHGVGDSGRLYVERVNGAASNTMPGSATASLGLGSVDSDGNVVFRVDAFGMDGTNPATVGPISGQTSNNYVRVNFFDRDSTPNWVRWTRTGAGTIADPVDTSAPLCSQTGDDVLRDALAVRGAGTGALVSANCPNIVPQQVAGRSITLGSCFDAGFRYESAPNVISESTAHLNAVNTDHRGNCNYTFRNFFPGSVNGTGAFLGYVVSPIGRTGTTNPLGMGGDAISISTFGLAADGAPVGNHLFLLPDASLGLGMVDPYGINPVTMMPFDTATDYFLPPGAVLPQFQHYQGSTFANGGSGPAAVCVAPDGQLMVASAVTAQTAAGSEANTTDRRNYIAVGRTSTPGGATEWVVAAWVNSAAEIFDDSTGKVIEDGAGNAVGRLTTWADYNGSIPAGRNGGPSLSDPTFDAVGNIYFIAPARLNTPAGEVKRLALIRGVRQQSPFGYRLEKLVAERDEFVGLNSGATYRISGLNLSIASGILNGTLWSNAANQETVDGADRSTLDTRSSATLGGVILSASITYDENHNASYADATDQNYQAVLFINGAPESNPCLADFNMDGSVDPDDLGDFINCYFGVPPCDGADFNNDGSVDPDDLGDFINIYFAGCA